VAIGGQSRALWWWLVMCAGACGDTPGELREWTPADHQPPAAVVPEGQGQGAEGGDDRGRAQAALWSMRCSSCHGAEGRGDGPGKPPGAALPDLTQAAWQAQRSDAEIAQVIIDGRGMMPPFGAEITEAGVAALVEHVRGMAKR
jgi:cytochrome c oxidase cbb3-type subunit 3